MLLTSLYAAWKLLRTGALDSAEFCAGADGLMVLPASAGETHSPAATTIASRYLFMRFMIPRQSSLQSEVHCAPMYPAVPVDGTAYHRKLEGSCDPIVTGTLTLFW